MNPKDEDREDGPGTRAATGVWAADLAAVAGELYSLVPGEFTAARNGRAKTARAGGDPGLARRIGELPKPSTAAWVVNMMATRRRPEIEEFLQVGASLREAEHDLDPEAFRQLNRHRHQLLLDLAAESRVVAAGLGYKISGAVAAEVEQTLRAALADPGAAAAVRSGQLIRTLVPEGVDGSAIAAAVAVPEALGDAAAEPVGHQDEIPGTPAPDTPGTADKTDSRQADIAQRRQARDAEATQRRAAARAAAAQAAAALDELNKQIRETAARREALRRELKDLRERTARLEQDAAAADWEARRLERDRTKAVRAADEARRRAGRARGDQA